MLMVNLLQVGRVWIQIHDNKARFFLFLSSPGRRFSLYGASLVAQKSFMVRSSFTQHVALGCVFRLPVTVSVR